ncbi:MAG TPA: TIGR03086 family metal-binding protein [Pseudonocardiaceae bacterium]|nr:TIGR03086 family metal-binding protein [Pseudonocardiaceae bacterium]
MEPMATYDRAAAVATSVVERISEEQFGLPTPCTAWTVRGVLNHIVIGNMIADAIVAGVAHPNRNVDHLSRVPKDTFARSMVRTRETLTTPGLFDRVVSTPVGERPGLYLVHLSVAELLVHSWDLAQATGQSTDLDAELVQWVRTDWQTRLGDTPRTLLPFGEPQPVPDQATAADRLAAYLGRSVVVA